MRGLRFLASSMLLGICLVSVTTERKSHGIDPRGIDVMIGKPATHRPVPEMHDMGGQGWQDAQESREQFREHDMYDYYNYDDRRYRPRFNTDYYYNADLYYGRKNWPDKRRGLLTRLIDSVDDSPAENRSSERESASFWKTDERRKSQRRRESVERAARESAELWWPGGSGTLVRKGCSKGQVVKKRGGWSDSTHPGRLSNLVKKAVDKVSSRRSRRDLENDKAI